MMNPTTTLACIRAHRPCADGWATGLKRLGPDIDAPISLGDIATSNGAADALWCIRALDWHDEAVRRAVIGGALLPAVERASAHTQDARVHEVVRLLRVWCHGERVDWVGARKLASAVYAADAAARAANAAANAARAANAADAADAANAAAYASAAADDAAASYADDAAASYADAANAAANAARAANAAANAADAVERARQCADLIAAFPPVKLQNNKPCDGR